MGFSICYNFPVMHYITATDEKRRDRWVNIFGVDRLPVLAARPRFRYNDAGRVMLAYDVAVKRLTQAQRDRFSAYVATRQKRPYKDVQAEMNTIFSWPVNAHGCRLAETEKETDGTADLSLFSSGRVKAAATRAYSH